MLAERRRALLEHYGVNADEPDWPGRLLNKIVHDRVPGFQIESDSGRKPDERRPAVDAMILNHFVQARESGKSWREVSMRLAAGRYGQGTASMSAERIRQRGYELLREENEEVLRAAWFWGRFTKSDDPRQDPVEPQNQPSLPADPAEEPQDKGQKVV